MPDTKNEVKVVFRGDPSNLNQAVSGLNRAVKRLNTSLLKIQTTSDKVSRSATRGFVLVAATATAAIIPMARFEKGMANVKTLLSGTEEEVKATGKQLDELAKKTLRESSFAIQDVTKAMFFLVSTTENVKDQTDRWNAAVKLAKGGVADLTTTVQAITGAMNAYSGTFKFAGKVARIFFVGQKFGATEVALLARNLGKVIPFAKRAGISLEQIAAATAQLTKVGLSTEEATTALKNAIASLIDPPKDLIPTFRRLGIAYGETALKGKDFSEILQQIAKVARSGEAEIRELFGSMRAATAIGALDTKALESYDNILKEIFTDTESLNRAVKIQESTFDEATGRLRNSASLLGIAFGEKLAPTILAVTEKLTKFNHQLEKLDPEEMKKIAKGLLALGEAIAIVAISAKALSLAAGAVSVITGIVAAITAIAALPAVTIAAIIALLTAIGTAMKISDEQTGFFSKTLSVFKNRIVSIKDALFGAKGAFKAAFAGVQAPEVPTIPSAPTAPGAKQEGEDPIKKTAKSLDLLGQSLKFVKDGFSDMSREMQSGMAKVTLEFIKGTRTIDELFTGVFQSILDEFNKLIAQMAAKAIFGFLTGGVGGFLTGKIPGFANGAGEIRTDGPAFLHRGEGVIPATFNQSLQQGKIGITGGANEQQETNNLLTVMISRIDDMANRPIMNEFNFGETELRILGNQLQDSEFERVELGV